MLKTLKDIMEIGDRAIVRTECELIIERDLRQSAIEWIKEFESLKLPSKSAIYMTPNFCKETFEFEWSEMEIIVKWIKHFFNISEEELYKRKTFEEDLK